MVSQGLLHSQESLAKHAESIPEQGAYPEFVYTNQELDFRNPYPKSSFLIVLIVTNWVQALFDAK